MTSAITVATPCLCLRLIYVGTVGVCMKAVDPPVWIVEVILIEAL